MQDLYGVLGLAPGADQETIKAAFRDLAKRSHPDVNVGDVAAEQRFKEFSRAYEILGDPEARAAYDRNLRRGGRRRRWPAIATTLTTFFLTIGLASTAALWTQDPSVSPSGTGEPARASKTAGMAAGLEEPSFPPEATWAPKAAQENDIAESDAVEPPPEPSLPAGPTSQAGVNGVPPPPQGNPAMTELPEPRVDRPPAAEIQLANWTSYRNARFGFSLKYPGEVFAAAETLLADGSVRVLVSRDGRAMLQIAAASVPAAATIAKYRRALMQQRYGGATYDYAPQQSHWFVLSGTRGEEMFYERITFSCDGRSRHGWQLTYPLAERAFYDRIVEEMHRTYRHGNGPGARCGEGKLEAPALPKPQAGLKDAPPIQF